MSSNNNDGLESLKKNVIVLPSNFLELENESENIKPSNSNFTKNDKSTSPFIYKYEQNINDPNNLYTYQSYNGSVTYFRGNNNIIITVPHGGILEPKEPPLRKPDKHVCIEPDWNTAHLSLCILSSFPLNNRPHMIIFEWSRSRVDMNRTIQLASDRHPLADEAYLHYHLFIQKARNFIIQTNDHINGISGLLIDLHGQSIDNRSQLGYTLPKDIVSLSKSQFNNNTYALNASSVRGLYGIKWGGSMNNDKEESPDKNDPYEVVIGAHSFGSFLEKNSILAVPSPSSPTILQNYFNGGYTTKTYGSGFLINVDSNNKLSVIKNEQTKNNFISIQVETAFKNVRENENQRKVQILFLYHILLLFFFVSLYYFL